MEPLINQVIHRRYRIQSLLGRQIGRRTFLADDLETQTPVVLKLLLFGPDFTWDALKLFEREADTLISLEHRAIPSYLDSFEIETELGQGFALVQSYIEARSLQDWVESGRTFSEEELKAIALSLLEIFDYLHSRRPPIIHRDIKPSNILLCEGDAYAKRTRSGNSPGQVYLVDFGSVQAAQHSGTMTVVGTYGYMPPEQFAGRTSPASDLYSLGTTLIYLLTGIHPADLPLRKGRLQFEQKCVASESFKVWLKYMIQPDLDQRFGNAQAALDALRQGSFEPLPARNTQPKGSRVKLFKTDEQLQVSIPAIPPRSKLKTVSSTLWLSCFLCLPFLLFLWHPVLGWLVTPVLGWTMVSMWASSAYTLFEALELSVNSDEIRLIRSWLGFCRSHSSPVQDIIKIERIVQKQDIGTAHFHYSGLNIWAGNHCYVLERAGAADNVRRLTEVELDWLAAELSNWLELPIQHFNQEHIMAINANSGGRILADTIEAETSPVSSTTNKTVPASPVAPLDIQPVNRPKEAVCMITKTQERFEISAPTGRNYSWLLWGCFIYFLGIPLLLSITVINPFAGLIVGFLPIVFWGFHKYSSKGSKAARILLQINQDEVSLWRRSKSQVNHRLSNAPLEDIVGLQLVYSTSSNQARRHRKLYHIELKTADKLPNPAFKKSLIVGNRRYWLSRREAYWLAYELSTWLSLPVTELEVIFQGA